MQDTENHQVSRTRRIGYGENISSERLEERRKQRYRRIREEPIRGRELALVVSIHQAEGLDYPNFYPAVRSGSYKVVCWVRSNDEYETGWCPDPVWKEKCRIVLDDTMVADAGAGAGSIGGFLHVEVLKCWRPGRAPDPGSSSSNGVTVVGRARIPLPKLWKKKTGRYGLVRAEGGECRAEGHIKLTLEMTR